MSRARIVLLTLFLLAWLPAAASALPGDAPFAPISPGPEAVVPVDPAGIPASYPCPVYRSSESGDFTNYGGPKDYTVRIGYSPRTGGDGRIIDYLAIIGGTSIGWSTTGDVCSGRLGTGGTSRLQETPSTYYWQVMRSCFGCEGMWEVGPVQKLTIQSTARPEIARITKPYAGFPVLIPLALADVPPGTDVKLERKTATSWIHVGAATASTGVGTAVATFARPGPVTLRARLTVGTQEIVSPEVSITVGRSTARPTTSSRDDGDYRDSGTGIESLGMRLRVAKKGRELRDVSALVPMTCPGIDAGQFTTQIGTLRLDRIRIAPDGRFVGSAAVEGTAMFLSGRLQGRKISEGHVSLSVGSCVADRAFTAKRRR